MANNHSKYKNTGILYELLVRQMANDILSNKPTRTLKIINDFFNQSSELGKELRLYQILIKDKFNDEKKATELLNIVLAERKKLDPTKLNSAKYNLVKEIKKQYDEKDFFRTNIDNYKIIASIYSLFESMDKYIDPKLLVESKFNILEFIVRPQNRDEKQYDFLHKNYLKEDKEIKIMAYKILIDRFNDKYNVLSEDQKRLLREYINSISRANKLRQFILTETNIINSKLKAININKIKDKTTVIKLNEIKQNVDTFVTSAKTVEDKLLTLMKYYELVKEIENLK
jgi:hypothetical protein